MTHKLMSARLPIKTLRTLQAVSALTGESQSTLISDALEKHLPTVAAKHSISESLIRKTVAIRAKKL